MQAEWIRVLLGAVVFGAAIVVAMVVPRPMHTLVAIGGASALVLGVAGIGAIVTSSGDGRSVALAIFFLLAGIVGGYWTAAAALPFLARRNTAVSDPPIAGASDGSVTILLVASAQPERYSARAVAALHHLLVEGAGLRIPATAAPFMFLSEKTRYRAAGGTLAARPIARSIAQALRERLSAEERVRAVMTAWTPSGIPLTDVVARARADGATRLIVVTLGSHLSIAMGHAREELDAAAAAEGAPGIVHASSLWHSTRLARQISDRILEHASDVPRDRLGVVLVAEGQPPGWAATHPGATEQENYFAQRVRLHLAEHGVDERHVRMGWLEWQVPDVTESVRHLAALGCTRIIVVPGLIPLPSLATAIDMQHAVHLARLNETVSVALLPPWGDDDVIVDALMEGIESALTEH